jgi:hypothetical protein
LTPDTVDAAVDGHDGEKAQRTQGFHELFRTGGRTKHLYVNRISTSG